MKLQNLHRALRGDLVLLFRRAELPVGRQHDPDVEACRAECLPRHRHDLRHHTGGIDLSVGSIVGLCGMVAGGLILNGFDPRSATRSGSTSSRSSLITLGLGVVIGAINGLLITRLNVAPFIATLGTLYVARGAGAPALRRPHLPQPRRQGGSRQHRLSNPGCRPRLSACRSRSGSWWSRARAAYLARFTPLGRHIYAVGGNERAAAPVRRPRLRVKMFVYMFSGFCAAIVGLVISSELMAGASGHW